MCREIIKENYSNWQERKVTEEESQKIKEMTLEREARLEKQKQKKEKFINIMETVSKEEVLQRRIQLAEIKENAWKWRRARTSHEKHSNRLEKERKEEKKEMSEKG